MAEQPDISVVIPAFGEEARLPATLARICEYLAGRRLDAEIIVVDDGSPDATSDVAHAGLAGWPRYQLLRNEPNAGKGASVRRGMLAATGALALFSDADLSTPIEELERLEAAHAAGADVAIGSRALRESNIEIHQPWLREASGRMFNLFIRLFVMGGLHDTQCGFKSFRHEVIAPVFSRQTIERWGFDVEILYLARRLGYQIAEVPVTWRNDTASKVNAAADGFRMLGEALTARRLHRGVRPEEVSR